MNNFEKQKLLSYLETLLPVTNINCYNFDYVFDFFCLEFKIDKTQYPLDEYNNLKLDNSQQQTKFKKIFRKDIQKAKKALTPKSTLLERQLLILKDVYSLSHEEYEIVKIKFDFMTQNQVNSAMEHFFELKNTKIDIKGLTTGDFATVKKKAEFLNINKAEELIKMLNDEVRIKKLQELNKTTIGF